MRPLALLLLPATLTAQVWTAVIPQPDASEWQPISQHERFALYAKSTFSTGTLAGAAAGAAISQARDRPEEWRQGMAGFGERTVNNLAKTAIRSTLSYGISAALNEDTRYISSGQTNPGSRIWYAASQTFAARNQNGHRRFAVSKFVANAGTSAVSRYWAPPSWQGGGNIARDFAVTSLVQAALNVTREFAPDLIRRIKP
jgi:hypothetical protein